MTERFETMQQSIDGLRTDVDGLRKDVDEMKQDIGELKEYSEVTRGASNAIIEKMEDLVAVLNETKTISFKF